MCRALRAGLQGERPPGGDSTPWALAHGLQVQPGGPDLACVLFVFLFDVHVSLAVSLLFAP